jgi:hypothetical protein
MITPGNIARRTPGLANVHISGQTIGRRVHEFGLRARQAFGGRTNPSATP